MTFSLFHMTLLFWIVMDPIGNVPIFVGILSPFEPKKQREIIVRELLIALGLMIVFLFFGQSFLRLLDISHSSLQLGGGIILFMIAINMIFATPKSEKQGNIPREPLIVPLAVPAVAGPAILATITLYGGGLENKVYVLIAICLAWSLLFPTLFFSPLLKKLLGENGIAAAERLFGYIVVLLSAQMAISGLLSSLDPAS